MNEHLLDVSESKSKSYFQNYEETDTVRPRVNKVSVYLPIAVSHSRSYEILQTFGLIILRDIQDSFNSRRKIFILRLASLTNIAVFTVVREIITPGVKSKRN